MTVLTGRSAERRYLAIARDFRKLGDVLIKVGKFFLSFRGDVLPEDITDRALVLPPTRRLVALPVDEKRTRVSPCEPAHWSIVMDWILIRGDPRPSS